MYVYLCTLRRYKVWSHRIRAIQLERIHILKETRLVSSFLSRKVDIPISVSLVFFPHSTRMRTNKGEEDLLHSELVLEPRIPLQIIHNTPSQGTNHIDALTNRNQNRFHILPIIGTSNWIKQDIRLERL